MYFYVPKWIKKKSDNKENSVRRVKSIYSKHFKNCGNESKIRLHMDQVICTFTNYVVYFMKIDQIICTCTYVELKSFQIDKVICTSTNYFIYSMQMAKVICIILQSFSPFQQIIWVKNKIKKDYLNKNANWRAKFFCRICEKLFEIKVKLCEHVEEEH